MDKVIIIGAGLSGLATGYYLKKENIPFKILEAQNRVGGRIETVYGNSSTPMEMGATWFSEVHQCFIDLLRELQIEYFEQHAEGKTVFKTKSFEPAQIFNVPRPDTPSYRVRGGTSTIVKKLIECIGEENIVTNCEIIKIEDKVDYISLLDNIGIIRHAKRIIVTIPSQILVNTVVIEPALPKDLVELMQNVQTWMSGSIKFAVAYEEPFWLKNAFSGTVFSQSGIIVEMYDHCNFEQSKFALMGFLNGSAVNYIFEQREQFVLEQIAILFGSIATKNISYHDKIWDHKFILTTNPKLLLAHQNNGHPILQKPLFNGKLFLSGTETAIKHPGYLEGAVASAIRTATQIVASRFVSK
jgi:monoamine oxidase